MEQQRQSSPTTAINFEASEGDTHKQETSALPEEVAQCLRNGRFLHLATSTGDQPHVTLMNYTYLASSTAAAAPVIVMTTNPRSRKTNNLTANPNVSLVVHDWTSHRSPEGTALAPAGQPRLSSLANYLLSLNSDALSRISATMSGTARLAAPGSAEEKYYLERHLENVLGSAAAAPVAAEDEAAAGRDEVRVIVVSIRDVRVSDSSGAVRDWVLVGGGGAGGGERDGGVNGA